eukprot:TRINITY_DN29086_c0_g1_i1.p2 TRINITY_DN29086_c0_g1~~TRINITY_DN29086_c0_g1_i1.p2  ORF type:complete len:373 (+),score=77.09 TRINITY_DN29086_c0_g1_i1:80-1120(+)
MAVWEKMPESPYQSQPRDDPAALGSPAQMRRLRHDQQQRQARLLQEIAAAQAHSRSRSAPSQPPSYQPQPAAPPERGTARRTPPLAAAAELSVSERARGDRLRGAILELQIRNHSLSGEMAGLEARFSSKRGGGQPAWPPAPSSAGPTTETDDGHAPRQDQGGSAALLQCQIAALSVRMQAAVAEEVRLNSLLAQPCRGAPVPYPDPPPAPLQCQVPPAPAAACPLSPRVFGGPAGAEDSVFRQPAASPDVPWSLPASGGGRRELGELRELAARLQQTVGRSTTLCDALLSQHGAELAALLPGGARPAADVLVRQLRQQFAAVLSELAAEASALAGRAAEAELRAR